MINKSQTPRTLLYKLDIPRHRPICGLRSHCPTTQALICETPSPLCCWFVWLEAQFQKCYKLLHHCLQLLETQLRKRDENPSYIDTTEQVILFTQGVGKQRLFVHSNSIRLVQSKLARYLIRQNFFATTNFHSVIRSLQILQKSLFSKNVLIA